MVYSSSAECASQSDDARLVGATFANCFWCGGYGDLAPLQVGVAVGSDIATRLMIYKSMAFEAVR